MTPPKILICAPHADRKNNTIRDWINHVRNFTYSNFDIFLADNSDTNKNAKWLNKQGVGAAWVNPKGKTSRQYIAESHELCRQKFLRGQYHFMLHLETDVFPPLDIIQKLLINNKPVINGCYFINHGWDSHLMVQTIEEHGEIRDTMNMGAEAINMVDGTIKKVYHAGLGCALIARWVLQNIEFRWEEESDSHPDSFFALDLHKLQIPNYLHTGVLCEHFNQEWALVTDNF
jgi:hypothetical protein